MPVGLAVVEFRGRISTADEITVTVHLIPVNEAQSSAYVLICE
jgi:hypothetical protein